MARKSARVRRGVALALVLFLAFGSAVAQAPAEPGKQPQAAAQEPEHIITKAEADDLFRSVDEILQFASKDTGLPIKHPVKRRLVSRDDVLKFLKERMAEDKDSQRLERSAISMKKLGILPRDFDLRSYLLGLLQEQVAGFYDAKTKTVNLLNWLGAEAQKPVLAHELTHALQDQNFHIDTWGEIKEKPANEEEDWQLEDARTARQAVTEGQAMIVLMDYMLAPAGRTLSDSPELADAMRSEMRSGGDSPMYRNAPLYLRESLIFPYDYGTGFEQALLKKGGRALAFTGALQTPPTDTRQVMHPKTYLAHESSAPLPFAPLGKVLGKGWTRIDGGTFGEIDLKLMLEQWSGKPTAERLSPGLRAGYYLTFQPKGEKSGQGWVAMTLRMATPQDAAAVAKVYGETLAKRYKSVKSVAPGEWETEEGLVKVSTDGDLMLSTESFDRETSAKLRESMVSAARPAPAK